MRAAELRRAFLDFFESKEHTALASSSLVPANDPSLFFVNAGMVQFKDVFVGAEKRPYSRATTVQKCMRVSGKHNDLENVGVTARHHTLFEMLGNFSFGDYFKREAIAYAWEFLTERLELPADRLLITVFENDEESAELWKELGIEPSRIGRCGEKDNFWSMGPIGPCGPCTEIHWDLQDNFVPDNEPDPWGFGHDAGRYMEIWNLVFMQFERYLENGENRERPLPRPSVDTGMGLERIAAITQGFKSNWELAEFQSVIELASSICGHRYGTATETDISLRVIADHSRAAAFLVGDGVMPSNEERGYVLRRILRRAIRHGVKLGINQAFMAQTSAKVIDDMAATYPELKARRDFILKVISTEEQAFRLTLDKGLALLDEAFTQLSKRKQDCLPGETVFELHDTFGFPPDLTGIIAAERSCTVDMDGYREQMAKQKERSRASWKGSGESAVAEAYLQLEQSGSTGFLGYEHTESEAEVTALLVDGVSVQQVGQGQQVEIVTSSTPFYAESGGQIGDAGWLETTGARVLIRDCVKPAGQVFFHQGEVTEGQLQIGQQVQLKVDRIRRAAIMRNHTATHLLHAALRELLGNHVQQKGSLVEADRLRFDFSHFEAITAQVLDTIEDKVNAEILANSPVTVFHTDMDGALESGAMALFGEKYGDEVRVVKVPGFSTELCGGTHCQATGEIGLLKITSEAGIASGVRRIEAITGAGAFRYLRDLDRERTEIAGVLKSGRDEVQARVERLLGERKALQRQVEELKQKLISGGNSGKSPEAREIAGVPVLALELEDVEAKELRGHSDLMLEKLGRGVVVLAARNKGKATLLVKISSDLTDRIRAGDLVRELAGVVGGKGGGRADMAQAGGKHPERIPEALEKAYEMVGAAFS
ncbi:MAG: alanine--tRNA ligase [Rickettsiales bacterium]|nr:alanine--tRNA ligase [Rickettsiales bacterium]|tara:strand:+ start:1673 stop:4324 length:2652 start_codon:yes stop_codon:yes gene_type:complete